MSPVPDVLVTVRPPANARWLLDSLAEARDGNVQEHELDRS